MKRKVRKDESLRYNLLWQFVFNWLEVNFTFVKDNQQTKDRSFRDSILLFLNDEYKR